MTRPAFTLLETMLAAAVGALLVAACVGVFAALESHEVRLRAREEQVQGLSRLHTVMRRAFSTMVLSDQPVRQTNNIVGSARTPGDTRDPATAAAQRSDSLASAAERARARLDSMRLSLPPRMHLEADGQAADFRMAYPPDAAHAPGPVQRFELLLTAHPLPARTWSAPAREEELVAAARARAQSRERGAAPADKDSGAKSSKLGVREEDPPAPEDEPAETAEETTESDEPPLPGSSGAAIRGAFELRPAADADGAPRMTEGRVASWTLYWQPLAQPEPPPRDPGSPPPPPLPAVPNGPPVEVATGLEYVHWQVFRQRERRGEHRAVWTQDVPAYIEMEIKTVNGLWANWMFEVDWVTGVEELDAAAGQAEDSDEDKPEGDGDSATDRTGGREIPKIQILKPGT